MQARMFFIFSLTTAQGCIRSEWRSYRLKLPGNRERCRGRGQSAEPVFGQIEQGGLRRILLQSLDKVSALRQLECEAYTTYSSLTEPGWCSNQRAKAHAVVRDCLLHER